MRENFFKLTTVSSTNAVLKEMAQQGAAHGTVVIASEQTQGKGRLGRSFQSPQNLGLYYSYLYFPSDNENLFSLTPLCAVAVCRALEPLIHMQFSIKWPNDLILNKKKVGGILVEALTENGHISAVIIGIGINLLHKKEDFIGDVQEIASSIREETGVSLRQEEVALAISEALDQMHQEESLLYYKERCITLGKDIHIVNDNQIARANDIDPNFGLCVTLSDGTEKILRIGEVSVRGLYGYVE